MPEWSDQSPLRALQQRAFLCTQIRSFFAQRQVLEVNTPVLSAFGNTDLQIDPFVSNALADNQPQSYLRTSPEFFHKRLLAAGVGDLFEMGPVFRQGERSAVHNPEFALLEWYRLDFNMSDLMLEVVDLVQALRGDFGLAPMVVNRHSYQSLFMQHLQVDPLSATLGELNRQCQLHGYHGPALDHTASLDFLFGVALAPKLNADEAYLIHRFPIEQAALAMQDPGDERCALRFEFLWGAVELANGYQELTDPEEQRWRFEHDNAVRKSLGKPVIPIDEHLLETMSSQGLPTCSGVALGLDRLLMCLLGLDGIRSLLPFPAGQA